MAYEATRRRWHETKLNGLLPEIDALVESEAKYLDPDLSLDTSTGIPLYERARQLRGSLVLDFPHLAIDAPEMNYQFPRGVGESLSRDDLRALRRDIEQLLRRLARQDSAPQ